MSDLNDKSARPMRRSEFGVSPPLAARGLGDTRLALGLAGLGGGWGPTDPDQSLETVLRGLECGVTAFDAAPSYLAAEKLLGRAMAQWPGPRPIISTKVGRLSGESHDDMRYDFSPQGMRDSVERSREILGVSRIDLLFLHEPHFVPPNERQRVVATLRQLQADGLAMRLGIAGGHGKDWNEYAAAGAFDVAMFFRRIDPCQLDGFAEDIPRLRKSGMATYGASPLHMGLLGARHHEFVRERPDWVHGTQIDRAIQLQALAEKHELSLSALAHRFIFGVAELDRVVIGASNREELESALTDFEAGPLPQELFHQICAVNFTTG